MGTRAPGELATEDYFNPDNPHPRTASERAGNTMLDRGVNVSVVRLPQVHDPVKQGLIPYVTALARQKGVSAYVGDGSNRWPAAHVSDTARLYKLVFEKAERGSRYNAVAEEGITIRAIAEVLGKGLNVPVVSLTPEQVPVHFGWMAMFAGLDMPASSAITQAKLNWHPTGPGLIADLEAMDYSKA
jgi:nucleoside-diphosphate-sugar epimerase